MAEFEKPDDINQIWSELGQRRKPSDSKIATGFIKEVPKFQDFNYIIGRQDEAIAHFNQFGIAEWDSKTEYQAYKSRTQGSDGIIYLAITTNTNINPVTDLTFVNWVVWSNPNTVYKPYVNIPPATNFAVSGGIPALKTQVRNGILLFSGGLTMTSAPLSSGTIMATLPVGYRPSVEQTMIAGVFPSSGSGGTALARIATNGQIILTLGDWGTTASLISLSGVVVL